MPKKHSTFYYLMRSNVLIVLLCSALLFSLTFYTVRTVQIENRMDALSSKAQDIAGLASLLMVQQSDPLLSFGSSPVKRLLEEKMRTLYQEYAAYCLIVDRTGQITTYFLSILDEHQELKTNFDATNIVSTLQKVLGGENVTTQNNTASGPMFTVAVPMRYNQRVLGAVYIQTAAQTVHEAYQGLGLTIGISAILISLLAALYSWRFNKRLTDPLTQMAGAAREVASGHFGRQVDESGTREMIELSGAFNLMSRQLEETEQTRRDFLANVSHELSSPITNIQGFVQGVLDGTIEKQDEHKYLGIVLDETKRISKLVSGLLSLSKMESEHALHYTVFDIHELIRRVAITKMNALEEKKHELNLSFDESPLYVHADRDSIEQVIINLMDNAIKYTPSHGEIAIQTEEQAKLVAVTLRDNGIGILPEDAPHIFDRFYMAEKAHTSGKGTGLGLAICQKILEKHGQRIALLPTDHGTAFQFTLEKAKEPLHEA